MIVIFNTGCPLNMRIQIISETDVNSFFFEVINNLTEPNLTHTKLA